MSRRGNGDGTISQRKDGRWEARVSLDVGRKCFYGKTRLEVAGKLRAALGAQEKGDPIISSSASFEAWANEWLTATKPSLRYSGWVKHAQRMRRHILPAIGRTPLAKITPAHLDRLYAAKLDAALSPRMVHHIHATIHACLELALMRGRVVRNVADQVKPPTVEAHEMSTLDEHEYNALLRGAAVDDVFGPFFTVLARTGMRKSELKGLRWRNVDLDKAQIRLGTALTVIEGGLAFATPKTKAGKRLVELTTDAVAALRRQRTRQNELRLAAGPAWTGFASADEHVTDLVFTREDGRPLADSSLRRGFLALLRGAGISEIRIHDLRHTVATLLLGGDVDTKIVSSMLGHARTSITQDLYQHVTPTMQRKAVAVLEAMGR